MDRGEIVQQVQANIEFFRTGCRLFYEWLDRYAKDIVEQTLHEPPPLQARVYRQEEQLYEQREKEYEQARKDYDEGKRADKPTRPVWLPWACKGYRSSLGTDYYCLTVYPEIGWVPTGLVHPLSCFRLSGRHASPLWRPLSAREQQMADCMTLAFVHSCEMPRQKKETRVFPFASRTSFDLKEFWGHLREKLDTPDGSTMIEEAWARTKTALERQRHGESVWDVATTGANGPRQAGGTTGNSGPHSEGSWQVPWNDKDEAYMQSGEARVKFTDDRLKATRLSKIIGTIPVHYMRNSGRGCRVHIVEFHAWAKREYPTDAERDEIATEYIADIEARKAEAQRHKRRSQ